MSFGKKSWTVEDAHPRCDTECGGECSTDTASSACCVYIGKCKRVWKAEEWGSCNATCGNGTRFRRVWCPFEDIFGPCEESSKPSNATKCRGDACPWSKDHFGNWSHCDNACGNGTEVQSLICQCPDDCPGKEKECAQSPKPQQPSRPCFPMSTSEAFCHSCETSKSQCTACTKGFDLKDGKCHGSQRLAVVKYELRAFNLSLNNDDWLSSAFVPAFKEVIQEAIQSNGSINASLDVLNLSISNSKSIATIRKLREGTSLSWTLVEVEMTAVGSDDDKSLEMLLQKLNNSKLNVSAAAFPKVLVKHGCTTARHCQVPENVTIQLKETSARCPEGKSWKDSECALPPIPPGPTGGFPMWIVVVIVVVLLLIAAGVTWSCVCKRRTETSRLLGAWPMEPSRKPQGIYSMAIVALPPVHTLKVRIPWFMHRFCFRKKDKKTKRNEPEFALELHASSAWLTLNFIWLGLKAGDESRWGAFYETGNFDGSLREPWRCLGSDTQKFNGFLHFNSARKSENV